MLLVECLCRCALTVWFTKANPPASDCSVPRALPDPDQPESRIFVSIAAFRDPETRWTVHDLLANASHPARVRIGIVWQIDAIADAHFLDLPHCVDQKQVFLQFYLRATAYSDFEIYTALVLSCAKAPSLSCL